MSTVITEPTTQLHVDRRALLAALSRVERIVPTRSCKPVLQGVRLEAHAGQLHLAATDLDMSIVARVATVAAEGELPRCVVPCSELSKKLKAGQTPSCTLRFDAEHDALIVNGGCIEHLLHTLDAAEFPLVQDQPAGQVLHVSTGEFKAACGIAQIAVAKENSRYAINGVLLESDAKGTRLVATDGRRLVVIDLEQGESAFTGQVILPARLVTLIRRLADSKQDEYLALHVETQPEINGASQPAKLFIAGRDWLLSTVAVDGMFPKYRDVLPPTGKRFVVDREQFLGLLTESALATDFECKGLLIELAADRVHVSAGSASNGTASGSVPATSPNASSRSIRTGFNAKFLLDAVRSVTCDRLVIDVQPNQCSKTTGDIIQKPGLFYSEDGPGMRWLIMPVNVDVSPKSGGK